MTRHAHSVHAVGDSAEQDLIRRGGEEEKAENLLSREQLEEAHRGCAPAPLCVQSNKQSVRNMAGGARKENRRERGTAHCMFAVTQTKRQGLTVMPIERPGGDIRTSRKEGVERVWRGSGGKLVNTEIKRAKHISC